MRLVIIYLWVLVTRQAQDSFFGRDGYAAWLKDIHSNGKVFVKINLYQTVGGVFIGIDGAAPEIP